MAYDPEKCEENLEDKGLGPICQQLRVNFHCDELINLDPGYHKTCSGAATYFPVIILVCHNPETDEYRYYPSTEFFQKCNALGSPWQGGQCYCCCSCFANDTLIAVPEGVKPIYTIPVGELVLSGSVTQAGGNIQMSWSDKKVSFSKGTGSGGHQPMMVYISYGPEGTHDLICSPDQPFLLASGKYTTAGKLYPGQQLVDKDGQPQTIKLASIGSYEGGVHHIATNAPWTSSPDGHLLLAGGVVAGDYTLQMYFNQLPDSLKEESYSTLPLLGTPEYDETHAKICQRSDVLFEFVSAGAHSPQMGQKQLTSGLFKTYRVDSSPVPYGAAALFTPQQAEDIAKNGVQVPISNPIPQQLFNSIKAQFAGFYPDIVFYYDPLDVTANLYAFEAYGQKIVQMSGGLARLQGFNYEGLFMAMAHGIARFYGGEPKNVWGYSAVGQADSYAFGVISRYCWISSPFLTYAIAAMNQWEAVFRLVDSTHGGGNPKDPLNDPSLQCRFENIQTAIAGGGLLECAGGEPLPTIRLDEAQATSTTKVMLTFSLALDPDTATDVSNYLLSPEAPVTSAELDEKTNFIVHLEVELEAGAHYEITVRNLTSILGSGLDPDHVSVAFDTP